MTTGDELGAIDHARREWEEGPLKKLPQRNGDHYVVNGVKCFISQAHLTDIVTFAARSSRKAIDIHGTYGLMKEYPVERYFRDAQTCIPAGATSEIMRITMARKALA